MSGENTARDKGVKTSGMYSPKFAGPFSRKKATAAFRPPIAGQDVWSRQNTRCANVRLVNVEEASQPLRCETSGRESNLDCDEVSATAIANPPHQQQ